MVNWHYWHIMVLDYLLHHYQCVSINNCHSSLLPVVSGVSQGSILGPLLFLVYINDMSSYIQQSKLLKFADDAKCFYTITTLSDSNSLQEDITSLFCWSMDSDLNFNLKKFVQLLFKHNFNTTYTMDNACTHTPSRVS